MFVDFFFFGIDLAIYGQLKDGGVEELVRQASLDGKGKEFADICNLGGYFDGKNEIDLLLPFCLFSFSSSFDRGDKDFDFDFFL